MCSSKALLARLGCSLVVEHMPSMPGVVPQQCVTYNIYYLLYQARFAVLLCQKSDNSIRKEGSITQQLKA